MVSKHIKSYKNYKILNIVTKSNCANVNNIVEGRIWFWTVYSDWAESWGYRTLGNILSTYINENFSNEDSSITKK